MQVKLTREKLSIPTYQPKAPNELPMFFENKPYQGATGRLYPLPYTDRLTNEAVDRDYDAVTLENEYVKTVLLPELGGKIHGAVDKSNGYEFIYQNTVIKPALVGLAGPWVSGGVEFNWPQHHRPTTFMPLEAVTRENADGSKTCIMGEAEPFNRMRGQVAVTVYPGCSLVEAAATVYNRTDRPLPFMWWNNLAVRVHPQYKATFPPDVEWGNDHDRRAVISFPVMKGVYKTARPFNYGEGTDVTWYSNVKLPTSVMVSRGQSDMDFLAGYDFAADAGTVTVSDHHYSVGKKMWTWGDGAFGHAWCANLTDNGDRYIELMTGVYTDNQPDFTYILPGETKTFTQVWYPVSGIGEVKNATRDAAVSFDVKDGKLTVGAIATRAFDEAALIVKRDGEILLNKPVSIAPDKHVLETVDVGNADITSLRVSVVCGGRELVSYQPKKPGRKPPEARPIPPRPKDVASQEELYLHGAHLMQYKHHTYKPEDYFMEALRRDPDDLRCNHAMGQILCERGDFDGARAYLEKAVGRLKMRNDNPSDTQPIYDLARLERLCGNIDRAYDLWFDASWQYAQRSASLYEIARIDALRGDKALACKHLEACLETNTKHLGALTLLGWLRGDRSLLERVLSISPMDATARFALWLLDGREVGVYTLGRPEDVLDAALDFEKAGLNEEAVRILRACKNPSQLIYCHLSKLTGEELQTCNLTLCHPNRLDDIAALSGDDWRSAYLLGCLYYDRMNYSAAVNAWERSEVLNPDYAPTRRNLAQAYFDHMNRPADARVELERALELSDSARILYELLQLYKNTGVSVDERIALLEAHSNLLTERDDCYLDYIILLTQRGEFDRAVELLGKKRFNIYEGGEGKLTRHHGWLYTLMGRRAEAAGDDEAAMRFYKNALVYPANYGEGRHYSAQEANIYYYAGLLCRRLGDEAGAAEAFTAGANQPPQTSEMTYFAAVCEEALGAGDKAREIYAGMCESAAKLLADADLHGYFGVGMASPCPYEQDVERLHTIDGLLLSALGEAGLGHEEASRAAIEKLEEMDPYNMKLSFFRELEIL
ncbi:MAG: DUF5107 domain-containing protein [Clostridia bacterium]|nr:DUF5107 domain-containing protein [Clostridia bacterium]